MTPVELLNLKKEIAAAKTNEAQLTGQRTAILKQLKDDLKCPSVEAAEKKLKALDTEIENISAQIDKGTEELEELLK